MRPGQTVHSPQAPCYPEDMETLPLWFRIFLLLQVFLIITLGACVPAPSLKTAEVQEKELTGTYTLILYGARYSADIETVGVLAREDTGYTFEVYAPDFDYTTKKNVPAREALAAARRFVAFHPAFRQSRLSAILDNRGVVVGYEVRPLYSPLDFGYSDVLDVTYILQDSRITIRIRLIPELDRPPFREDSPFFFRFML